MKDIENLIFFIYLITSILSGFYLLYKALKKKGGVDLLLSLSYLLPLLAFTIAASMEKRLGHPTQYLYLFPLSMIVLIKGAKDLQVSKKIVLPLFLLFSLLGLNSYMNLYPRFIQYYVIKEKSKFIVKDPLTLNVFFILSHPFHKEVALFYGGVHNNIKTSILDIPVGPREMSAFVGRYNNFKRINLIFLENDSVEERLSKEIITVISNAFVIKDLKYSNFEGKDHLFLKGTPLIIKNILFSRN